MTQRDREILEAFEMWCWRRMEKISWTHKVTNQEVLRRVNKKRVLMEIIQNRRGKMIGHLIRHDNFMGNIIEGKIEGKRGRGRPWINYMSQVKEKVAVESYKEVKEKALERKNGKTFISCTDKSKALKLEEEETILSPFNCIYLWSHKYVHSYKIYEAETFFIMIKSISVDLTFICSVHGNEGCCGCSSSLRDPLDTSCGDMSTLASTDTQLLFVHNCTRYINRQLVDLK